MLSIFLVFACWLIAIIAVLMIIRHVSIIRRGNDRIQASAKVYTKEEVLDYKEDEFNGLRGWLYRAGYRANQASTIFFLVMLASICVGAFAAFGFINFGFQNYFTQQLNDMPGGAGDVFRVPFLIIPYLLFFGIALLPVYIVVQQRKIYSARIQQGMPIILELLATLSESGLTFDGAIEHILLSYRRDHPLAVEFKIYQADLRSGRGRVECLRRMAKRIDVIPFTAFISAIVLAEQRGASISTALRSQAEELRRRRREKALEIALTAPLKRVIPMVVFFLPGIFIFTLGPIYFQIFNALDLFLIRGGGF
ncbi:MAG: type II secretion system F family protein [Sumerlaeia bacterium]